MGLWGSGEILLGENKLASARGRLFSASVEIQNVPQAACREKTDCLNFQGGGAGRREVAFRCSLPDTNEDERQSFLSLC